MTFEIDVSVAAGRWREELPEAEENARRAAMVAFDAAGAFLRGDRAEASLVLADDAFVRRLNREYRGRDEPTNVLSFAGLDGEDTIRNADKASPVLLGDVVVAFETVVGEAAGQGKSVADHFSHMIVHAMLHLLGYDHMTEAEAERMEGMESRILGGLGIADPYSGDSETTR